MDQLAEFMTKKKQETVSIGLTQKKTQGQWLRKAMVSLWFVTDTSTMMMTEVLKMVKKDLADKNNKVWS